MFLVFLFVLTATSLSVNGQGHWEADDPRWDEIPSWWDEENFVPPVGPVEERSRKFWVDNGQELLKKKLEQKLNMNKARNLVIFIADGLGISTQMAARVYKEDVRTELSFEKFPYAGLAKTYCINYQVPDSSCTAQAILTGIKGNLGTSGVTGDVNLQNCTAERMEEHQIDSIFKYAQEAGKATGIVTNTRITHATPAAVFAKTSYRYWEDDQGVLEGCQDLAYQLVYSEVGKNLDVIFGGGWRSFYPNTFVNEKLERGTRTDNRNLIDEFKEVQRQLNNRVAYVQSRDELFRLRPSDDEKVLGLFSPSHMEYKLLSEGSNEPTLAEMTEKAIEKLRNNEKGFVLMVEGGRIDHAHHDTRARLALEETLEFEKTIELVRRMTLEEDTLIVVTSDHGHVLTVGGYAPRNQNILGVGDFARPDNMWMFTLGYANGPGYEDHTNPDGGRVNPRGMNYMHPNFRQPTTVNKDQETHSGEDVGVFASGPMAHIFSGVYEQSYIAHAMAYAACLGPEDFEKHPDCADNSSSTKSLSVWLLIASIALVNSPFRLFRE